MSGYAFAVMLMGFVVILGWYILNHERDRDGQDGILGIDTSDGEDDGLDKEPGYALRAIRDRKSAAGLAARREARRPTLRVREKADEARKKRGGPRAR